MRLSRTLKTYSKRGRPLYCVGLPDMSYKRECQETFFSVGSVPTLFFLGIQPNRWNMHARIDEWSSSGSRCFVSWYESVRVPMFFPPVVPFQLWCRRHPFLETKQA
jgi:hypothetical protein